jgi:hypothetical protein
MTDIEAKIPSYPKLEETQVGVDPLSTESTRSDEIENNFGWEENHGKFEVPKKLITVFTNEKRAKASNKSEHKTHHFDPHHIFNSHTPRLPHVHLGDWRHHHFHLWTAHKLPHRSSIAHELARAEAASWAQMTPLIAATLGPLAVLLGIANLAQRWHGLVQDPPVLPGGYENFIELPDPRVNIILGAITLVCEVLGNLFLMLRFSNFHSRFMTWASYIFWIAKVIFALANCIQFGITHPETGAVIYLQGYWV